MTIYRGPGGTGSATSDADTTQFQEFLVQSQAARDAAQAAQTAAELAETHAETAETNAETAETNAETAATNAAASASTASSSASTASSSASAASTSASSASTSASSASTSASSASTSASAASTSATAAAISATNAAASAIAAASSATSASSSASTATTQASNAASSASAASTSATSASSSASSAATSATNAASSETSAASSATAAASSATAAAASAASINDANLVHKTGAETIAGTKTFSVNQIVSVTDNTNAALRVTQLGTGDSLVVEDSTNPDSTPFVINNAGTVVSGYGTSVVTAGSAVAPRLQVHGLGGGSASAGITSWSTGGNVGPSLVLSRSEGGVVGTQTIVDSGDHLGNIRFAGSDGTAFIEAAKITGEVDGTPGLSSMSGRLVFSTTAGGASSPTERVRINNSGAVGFAGANFGTSGQMLVSRGAAASPVWTDGGLGFRNRIINGDMRIDQRNNGASVNGDSKYPVDRWTQFIASNFFSLTSQQSSTAPAGFTKSILYTATTAGTATSTQYAMAAHKIEGYNVADLGWGTANAQTVTLSFWVRSSLTGSFSGAVKNSAENRSYPFSFAINAANTYEYKTVTIPGDTSGTWLTDNSAGIVVNFDLGSGSTFRGTAGAWAGANYTGVTGSVSFSQTNGATFYITGVQLEAGTVASPFERRDYGRELMMCQRYYQNLIPDATPNPSYFGMGPSYTTSSTLYKDLMLPVQMRSVPTASLPSTTKTNLTSVGAYPRASNRIELQAVSSTAAGDTYFYCSVFNASAEL